MTTNWVDLRIQFLLGLMKRYCDKYGIVGWTLKFSDLEKDFNIDAAAICHKNYKCFRNFCSSNVAH